MRERGSRDGRIQGPGARGGGVARRASGRGRATTTHLQIYSFCTLAHISGRSDGSGWGWRGVATSKSSRSLVGLGETVG